MFHPRAVERNRIAAFQGRCRHQPTHHLGLRLPCEQAGRRDHAARFCDCQDRRGKVRRKASRSAHVLAPIGVHSPVSLIDGHVPDAAHDAVPGTLVLKAAGTRGPSPLTRHRRTTLFTIRFLKLFPEASKSTKSVELRLLQQLLVAAAKCKCAWSVWLKRSSFRSLNRVLGPTFEF